MLGSLRHCPDPARLDVLESRFGGALHVGADLSVNGTDLGKWRDNSVSGSVRRNFNDIALVCRCVSAVLFQTFKLLNCTLYGMGES